MSTHRVAAKDAKIRGWQIATSQSAARWSVFANSCEEKFPDAIRSGIAHLPACIASVAGKP